MIKLFFAILFLFIVSCTSGKGVYWCGDHPCINKKEKEAYFKKTMIVEVRNIKKSNFNNKAESQKIIETARKDEKKRILKEKDLAKQAKLEEKKRIQEEKDLAKQIDLDEKKILDKEKQTANKNIDKKSNSEKINYSSTSFNDLVKMIAEKNSLKPFPDINKIPR